MTKKIAIISHVILIFFIFAPVKYTDEILIEDSTASLSYNSVLSQEECANEDMEVEETIQLGNEYDGFEEEVQNACASDKELIRGEIKNIHYPSDTLL